MLIQQNRALLKVPFVALMVSLTTLLFASREALAQWTQFGGPDHAFRTESTGLARSWPTEGPPRLWQRKLGEGYSSILADGGRLYTMYRASDKERVISLNAKTGETIWEYAYDSSPLERNLDQFGKGPRSTPLLSGGRLYTIGVAGVMHCLDAATGEVYWTHDFVREFGGFGENPSQCGYSPSPIEYKDTVIALVGGKDRTIVAFDKMDGHVVWESLDFEISYATPRIMRIHGRDQLVAFLITDVIGADPDTGKLQWKFPCENEWRENVTMPVLVDENTVMVSGPGAGTRCIRITKDDDGFHAQELWSTSKLQIYHRNSVQLGDYIYALGGGVRAAHFVTAINVKNGKIAWRKRGFGSANLVYADGLFIILDEDGSLSLATAGPDDFTVHSKVPLLKEVAWTVPTIVGTTLYVRDQSDIMALNLGG